MSTPAAFFHLADLVRRRSGLDLTPDKMALIRNRLVPVARQFGYPDVIAMMAELSHPPEELAAAVTEAMTTNETSFFRDQDPFFHFRDALLPDLCAARAPERRLRIWCAGVSTGQEAYSLAILLEEARLAAQGWKIDLIATDFSGAAIARAKEGVYSQFEAQRGLPPPALVKYFTQEGIQWRISERLRRAVTFRTFNLLDDFGWLGELDLVFCRNVLLYFDQHMRASVLTKIAECLAAHGRLVLGAKESGGEQLVAAMGPRGTFTRPRGATLRVVAWA